MKTVLYFAYGSNMDTRQMKHRCPSAKPVMVRALRGYMLDFTFDSPSWGGGVADIVKAPGKKVWGCYLRNVST